MKVISLFVCMAGSQLAKNTVYLYVRMAIVLVVSLYTTRLVLRNLGIEDYGIYNVVGSIVSLFSFLQVAITSANYRYMAFAIGKDDIDLLATTMKCAIVLCLTIAFFVVLLGESLGLYFIYNYLNVPTDRFASSVLTFHVSLATCAISTLYMPFYSEVISHERMDFFTYLSIIEVFFKVGIAVAIAYSPIDRLIFYAFLLLLMQSSILLSYYLFCFNKFEELKLFKKAIFDKSLFKKMTSFSGWTLFVAVADLFVSQGLNILINIFYSPVVNAARGIAVQIQGAVDNFRGNLQTALNPQITKRYANNNYEGMYYLMSCSARFSTYIMLGVAFPIFFSAELLLSIWLERVPSYAASFTILIIVSCIVDGISNPYVVAISATGNVKRFQAVVGLVKFLTLPMCYLAALCIPSPVVLFLAYLIGTLVVVLARIILCSKAMGIEIRYTLQEIFAPILYVLVIGFLVNYILINLISIETAITLFLYSFISFTTFTLCCYVVGLKKNEREYIKVFLRKRIGI